MIPMSSRLALKLALGLAAALLLALLVHDRNRWKAKTSHYAELLAGERAAHAATVANYRVAAEQARLADAANVRRVAARQASISKRTEDDYENRIAAARAAAGRLFGKPGAAADPGRGRGAPVPALSVAAGSPAQAAGEDGFSHAERLTATEQAIQLDELIQWVRQQAEVEVSSD